MRFSTALSARLIEHRICIFNNYTQRYVHRYRNQYIIDSPNSGCLMRLFHQTCGEYGIVHNKEQIFAYLQALDESPEAEQISLWG